MANGCRDSATAVADVIRALGMEMSRMLELAERAQAVAGNVLSSGCHLPQETLTDLQGLDVITQTLDNLRGFFDVFSRQIPLEWRVDTAPATENLLLSALVTRLTEKIVVNGIEADEANVNDVELFGI